jgi:NAD(P)H-binding
MTITVLGGTGKVGSLVARGLLQEAQAVRVLVRNPGKARDLLGSDPRLQIIAGALDNPSDLDAALHGASGADAEELLRRVGWASRLRYLPLYRGRRVRCPPQSPRAPAPANPGMNFPRRRLRLAQQWSRPVNIRSR